MVEKEVGKLGSLADWRGLLTTIAANQKNLVAQKLAAGEACARREATLTKPAGSLGRLENLSNWFYRTRGQYDNIAPAQLNSQILVFAGNHGVAAANTVSAFPPSVTAMMVQNFAGRGAAINQLASWAGATLRVLSPHDLRPTNNFANATTPTPAMSEGDCCAAMALGFAAVAKQAPKPHVVVLGEMGIGNSTAASAICYALYGEAVSIWVGRGTGIDDQHLAEKKRVVELGKGQYEKFLASQEGAANHAPAKNGPIKNGLATLQFLGGYEMAAIAGAIVAGLYYNIPIMLDSYVTVATLACLAPYFDEPAVAFDGVLTPHCPRGWYWEWSDDINGPDKARVAPTMGDPYYGHALLLRKLGKEPLVDLHMRLGEGTGGAVALQLLRGALHCHHGMASFAEAGVAEKITP